MIGLLEFTNPRTIAYGEEALEYLRDIDGNRAIIVCGKSVRRLGFVDKVSRLLTEAGLEIRVFDEVEPEPSIATIENGSKEMTAFGPDWIVAVGGGSSMDAAKAMWVLYEIPDYAVGMINPLEKLGLRKKARMICVPTTSGSGSEATWATIVTDIDSRLKMELASRELVPDVVILDPELPSSMPPSLTAQSGMDVLAHAVEAYASEWRNDFSEALAIKAIQLVFSDLSKAYEDGSSAEARGRMHNAATMAGLAFSNSNVGASHTMGHSLGAVFKVPHGRCVGLFLPFSIEFSAPVAKGKYAEIARAIGLRSDTEDEAVRGLVEAIRALKRSLHEPNTVQEAGIDETEYFAKMGDLVDRAMMSATTAFCPRIPSAAEYRRLFTCAYRGDLVDF